MSPKNLSVATLSRLFAILVGLIMWASCGGSSSTTTTTGSPAVTLSASTLTFASGVNVASAPQTVTVTDSGTAALTFTSISASPSSFVASAPTCGTGIAAGGSCTISVTFTPTAAGTVPGTLTITDNASGSPQTVTLSGTGNSVSVSTNTLSFSGVTVGTTSAAQSVTVNNAGTAAVAISTPTISGDFAISNNTCGSSVAPGSCTISITFSPVGSGPWTGTLTFVVAGVTETVTLTGSSTASNTVPVSVNFGPTGSYTDGIFTTVSVCEPGTTTCVQVQNVLVDTGSVGLRILSSALTGVTLSQLNDGSGDYLNECTQYGDGSFNWGPVSLATVQIGGETASQVPTSLGGTANSGIAIQVISTDTVPTAVTGSGICVNTTNTPDDDTVAALGSNGILGIGNFPQDCGGGCTTTTGLSGLPYPPYWLCTSAGVCGAATVPYQYQVYNPVAAFSSADTNGVLLTLPSIPAAGQATATGTLTFGIGTETNNAIPSGATVYEIDDYGNFASATYNGVSYNSTNSGGSYIDSGSNALYISDATTLGATDCPGDFTGFYCSTQTLNPLTLTGANGTSTNVTLSIEDAETLVATGYAAFNDLAGPSCIATTGSPCTGVSPSPDYFDLGLPFFFGQPNGIFVGIYGTNTTYPNGYWAF